jgi:FtsP/CotA-like multicopper oxidase with cupredoxin domain
MQMRAARRVLAVIGAVAVIGILGWLAWAWYDSRLPSTYNVMDFGTHEYGGGPVPAVPAGHEAHPNHISVADLRGPQSGMPDARFELTAKTATIRLPSGRTMNALTFDGRVPGPELRVHQGDLVEVTLLNEDVEGGVSIHWHGVDVPNAEDGVSGVTQDAVLPGGRHVYRFRADQLGTFWYHTHQSSADDVRRGLYGAFVIEPGEPADSELLDLTVLAHDAAGRTALNGADVARRRAVEPGTPVRLRLVNTNSTPRRLTLTGTPFRVVAIDGTDLNGPTPLEDVSLQLAGGGRYDVAFDMPSSPVELATPDGEAELTFSPDGEGDLPPSKPGADFDPSGYGAPTATPFDSTSDFDREFTFTIGRKPGFLDGRPGRHWSINGGIFPDVPVFVVSEGDLVKVTIVNDTKSVHPMHLHGHHMLVLSRDGEAVSGSPWWSDTLNLERGERFEVAFRADNPGLWMDHCHNLRHAAEGLTMHVAYAGVMTPFTVGGTAHNHPE